MVFPSNILGQQVEEKCFKRFWAIEGLNLVISLEGKPNKGEGLVRKWLKALFVTVVTHRNTLESLSTLPHPPQVGNTNGCVLGLGTVSPIPFLNIRLLSILQHLQRDSSLPWCKNFANHIRLGNFAYNYTGIPILAIVSSHPPSEIPGWNLKGALSSERARRGQGKRPITPDW